MSGSSYSSNFFQRMVQTPIWTSSAFVTHVGAMGNPVHNPNAVGEIHKLVIVNYSEDVGQDGYEEELDYEIIHPYECEKQIQYEYTAKIGDPIPPPIYVCEMAKHLATYQLDKLDMRWTDLEPGEYPIQLEQSAAMPQMTSGSGHLPPEIPTRIVLL